MDSAQINKSMDRDDLLTEEGQRFVTRLSGLAEELDHRRLPVTSWYGALTRPPFEFSVPGLKAFARRLMGGHRRVGPTAEINRGGQSYESVPGIARDNHHPWFLYWEAFWVSRHGPQIDASMRVLDAGGTASLFSCHLASTGAETHTIDTNPRLVAAGIETARAMRWNLQSYCMDMTDLQFDDDYFDHAYSICVFEHLDAGTRRQALDEIARVLKPGGILSLTFDYGAPGVILMGSGPDYDTVNAIRSSEDVYRHLLSSDRFEPVGNVPFFDNGKTYLAWPPDPSQRYTFGAAFIRKVR